MNKTILLCCLCWLYVFKIYSQNVDSLRIVYQRVSTTAGVPLLLKIPLLETFISSNMHQRPQETLPIIDTLASYYQQIGDFTNYHKVRLQYKGFLYAVHRHTSEALKHYQEYVQIAKPQDEGGGYLLIDIGNLYYSLKLYRMARKYYEEAENLFYKLQNYKGLATTYGNYSLVAKNLNELDTAFFYIQKALDIQQTYVRDTFQIAHIYHVIGRLHSENKGEYQQAIPLFEHTIKLLQNPDLQNNKFYAQFIYLLPESYMRAGLAWCELGKNDTCFQYLDTALTLAQTIAQPRVELEIRLATGKKMLKLRHLSDAQQQLATAEKLALSVDNQRFLLECYQLQRETELALGRYEMATVYWKKCDSLQQLLQSDDDQFLIMNDQILQQERQLQIQEQQKAIEIEARNVRWILMLLSLALVALLVAAWAVWAVRRKNKLIEAYAQELKANNATKDILLMTIGHDLRSPFGGIVSNVSELDKSLKMNDLQNIDATMQRLVAASKSAYMMMDGVMQWAVLQREKNEVRKQPFRLDWLVEDTIALLQPIVNMSLVQIKWETLPCSVESDPNMLRVVLRNLLTNAIKYSPKQSYILLKMNTINSEIQINIFNEGGQIPTDLLDMIQHSRNYYEIAKKGSGLGLLLVKEFADQLGIRLQLCNQPSNMVLSQLVFPAAAIVQMSDTVASPATAESVAESVQRPTRAEVAVWLEQLQRVDVYESTAIKTILAQIPTPVPAHVALWRDQILDAVYQLNEDFYTKLIDL